MGHGAECPVVRRPQIDSDNQKGREEVTDMTDPIVTVAHCRTLGYCARGMRAFFARHSLDWDEFRHNGSPASKIEATGDAMAIAAASLARHMMTRGDL